MKKIGEVTALYELEHTDLAYFLLELLNRVEDIEELHRDELTQLRVDRAFNEVFKKR